MSKTIWQGAISFGLVEIQVGLYPAEHSHDLGLKMLDRKDFSPVGYKRYNKTTQREIDWDDIVRGYEYTKGEYVVLSDEELRRANPAVTQMVRILYFVDAKEIEPIYFEKPYYLAPLSKKSRGYALLRDTLKLPSFGRFDEITYLVEKPSGLTLCSARSSSEDSATQRCPWDNAAVPWLPRSERCRRE
jgi:DNA end-binding protein Ku